MCVAESLFVVTGWTDIIRRRRRQQRRESKYIFEAQNANIFHYDDDVHRSGIRRQIKRRDEY